MPTQPNCPYQDFAIGDPRSRGLGIRAANVIGSLPVLETDPGFGYPELCNLPNGNLLASTWRGHCLEINPDSGHATTQPRIGLHLSPCLGSPAATSTQPTLCSAATRVVWTDLWELGAARTVRVTTGGPVNSVALSPQGDLLATGLGMYPLAADTRPRAEIELFSTTDVSKPLAKRVLPGVAVDRVVFDRSRELLIALTGARCQDRGHVLMLDWRDLNLLDVAETDFICCCATIVDPSSNRLILAHRGGIQVRSLDKLWNVEWASVAEGELFSAAYDPASEWIFLSNGQILSPNFGEVARLPALDSCTGLAILPGGRLAGINQTGVLRVWNVG